MSGDKNMHKTCLLCASWHPEGKLKGIIRHGGTCNITKADTRMTDTCWAWNICSPNSNCRDGGNRRGWLEEVGVIAEQQTLFQNSIYGLIYSLEPIPGWIKVINLYLYIPPE